MPGIVEEIVNGTFYCILAASLFAWVQIVRKKVMKRLPILEPQTRKLPFWTLAEFFVCFGMFIVCTAAGQTVSRRWMSPATIEKLNSGTFDDFSSLSSNDLLIMIMTGSVASLLAMLSVVVWMNLVSRRLLNAYGLWPNWDDIKLGCKAAFFVLPPVLLISTVIDHFVAYEHQVLDAIGKQPAIETLCLLTFTTVLFTPIFEEFLFRMLLQGGAEQIARRLKLTGRVESLPEHLNVDPIPASEVATWPWWPVLMGSATFSMMHIGQGAAPIPLFFLALALGYLYRQTGRLWPCITVHMILNTFTIVIVILTVYFEK